MAPGSQVSCVTFTPMKLPDSFLWHDYETFGANPMSDRPAQFAAQRTDADLNPLGEPVTWYCAPANDVLPDTPDGLPDHRHHAAAGPRARIV